MYNHCYQVIMVKIGLNSSCLSKINTISFSKMPHVDMRYVITKTFCMCSKRGPKNGPFQGTMQLLSVSPLHILIQYLQVPFPFYFLVKNTLAFSIQHLVRKVPSMFFRSADQLFEKKPGLMHGIWRGAFKSTIMLFCKF